MYLRIIAIILILISIGITYHVKVIRGDFLVIENPDGPDTSDYLRDTDV